MMFYTSFIHGFLQLTKQVSSSCFNAGPTSQLASIFHFLGYYCVYVSPLCNSTTVDVIAL